MPLNRKNKSNSFFISLLLICLSLSPLLVLEIYLRATDYGYADRLFELDQANGQYVLNRQFYQKYFPKDQLVKKSRIPELLPELSLPAHKHENTFRIFCLGGSTTRGDFSDNRFPDLLAEMLVRSEINAGLEVYNLGITTFNSFQVADIVAEIVHYDPDLLIIYMGHNEIYGPLGVASTSRISTSYRLTRAVLFLQRFKTFQLLQNWYLALLDIDTVSERQKALFKVMAQSRVPPLSPLRDKALLYFSRNLDRIIDQAHSQGIPLILTTVASNIRDFRPFDSSVPGNDTGRRWHELVDSAASLAEKGRLDTAAEKFLLAIRMYPENARQYYDLGHVYMAQGQFDAARLALTRARDFDIIPFRAASGINNIIKNKAGESGLRLLDVEAIFQDKSDNGLIGKPIMIEHLHPSAYGHYLIAAGLVRAIFDAGLLQPGHGINFNDPAVRASFNAAIYSENFDGSEMWPFTINNKDYRFP